MAREGSVAAARLKSFIERVEKLEEERKAIGDDVRDVYAEAKGVGYDVPAMRRLVAYRKLNAADRAEREALDDVYRHALGMAVDLVASGLSLREAAAATGASKSSIHRAISVPALSREMVEGDLGRIEMAVHDPDTGDIETAGADLPGDGTGTGVASAPAPAVADPTPAEALATLNKACPAPEIDLAIPTFLDRRRQVAA